MKARKDQAKTLWRAFLKDRADALKQKSRRKLMTARIGPETKGGREYWKGDDPEIQTDRDEVGEYNFWGAT